MDGPKQEPTVEVLSSLLACAKKGQEQPLFASQMLLRISIRAIWDDGTKP